MADQIRIVMAESVKARKLPATPPPGARYSVSTWYETILLPKGTDRTNIRQLADVPRYGGKILSQEGGFILAAALYNAQ
jgi:hypothetical protein